MIYALTLSVFFKSAHSFKLVVGLQDSSDFLSLRSEAWNKIKLIHQLRLCTKWKKKGCGGLEDMGISGLYRFICSRLYSSVVLGLKNLVASTGPFTMAVSGLGLLSWAGEWQFLSHQIVWYLIQGGTPLKINFPPSEGKEFCICIYNAHLVWLSSRKQRISSTGLVLQWRLPSASLTLDKSSTWQLIKNFTNLLMP